MNYRRILEYSPEVLDRVCLDPDVRSFSPTTVAMKIPWVFGAEKSHFSP